LQRLVLNLGKDEEGFKPNINDQIAKVSLCRELSVLVRVTARQAKPGLDWDDTSTWRLIEAVLARVDDERPADQPHLFAAKVLLGLAGSDRDDVMVPGRDNMTLGQLRASDRRLVHLVLETSIELRKAFVVRLFPNLTEHTALRYNAPDLRTIGTRLARAIEDELASADLTRYAAPPPPPSANVQPAAALPLQLAKLMQQVHAKLDQPSNPYYPARLTSRNLVEGMQIQQGKDPRQVDDEETQLVYKPSLLTPSFRVEGRMFLSGGPGVGKSTIASALLAWHIDEGLVGVFVRADRLAEVAAKNGSSTVTTQLIDAFEDWLAEPLPNSVRTNLRDALQNSSALVVIDGLDEVSTPVADAAIRAVIGNLTLSPVKLLVTTRPGGPQVRYDAWRDGWYVKNLPEQKVMSFIQDWFGNQNLEAKQRAEAYLDVAEDVARLPLMLGFVAILSATSRPPISEADLFDACIGLFLTRIWKPLSRQRNDDFTIESVRRVVVDMAWNLTLNQPRSPRSKWIGVSGAVSAADILAASRDGEVARELVRVDGLLVARGTVGHGEPPTSQRYGWLHRSIVEHLLASALAELYIRDRPEAERYLWQFVLDPQRWAEVFRRTIGMLSQADQGLALGDLVERLKDADLLRPAWHLLTRVIRSQSTREPVRSEIAARLERSGDFRNFLDVMPGSAGRLVESDDHHLTQSGLVELFRDHDGEVDGAHLAVPPSWWLIERVRDQPAAAEWLLTALARQTVDAAIVQAVHILDAAPDRSIAPNLPSVSWPSYDSLNLLVSRIESTPFPGNLRYAALLGQTEGGRAYAEHLSVRRPTVLLATFGWKPRLAKSHFALPSAEIALRIIEDRNPSWAAAAVGGLNPYWTLEQAHRSTAAEATARLVVIHEQLALPPLLAEREFSDPERDGELLFQRAQDFQADDAESVLAFARSIDAEMRNRRSAKVSLPRYAQALFLLDGALRNGPNRETSAVVDPDLIKDIFDLLILRDGQFTEWDVFFNAFLPFAAGSAAVRVAVYNFVGAADGQWFKRTIFQSNPMEKAPAPFLAMTGIFADHGVALLPRVDYWLSSRALGRDEHDPFPGLVHAKPPIIWGIRNNLHALGAWLERDGRLAEFQ